MLKQRTQWGCSYVWAPASTQTCKLAQFMLMQSHKSTKMKARACVPPNPAQKGNTPPAPPDVHVLVQGVHRLCGCFTLSLFCIPADFHTLGVIPGRVIVIQITSDTKSINNRWRIKAIFSRHGIPTTLQSDTGPQFDSSEFQHLQRNATSPALPTASITLTETTLLNEEWRLKTHIWLWWITELHSSAGVDVVLLNFWWAGKFEQRFHKQYNNSFQIDNFLMNLEREKYKKQQKRSYDKRYRV